MFSVGVGAATHPNPGFLYSAVVFAGGVMGFVKKGSIASLVAGGGTGALLGWGAYVGMESGLSDRSACRTTPATSASRSVGVRATDT